MNGILKIKGPVPVFLALAMVFVLAGSFWSFFALHASESRLILHFNEEDGITQTGSIAEVMNIGFGGLLLVLINGAIALSLDKRDRFWGKIVSVATLFMGVLIFIALAAIISVN